MKKGDTLEIDSVIHILEEKIGDGGAAEVWRVRAGSDGQVLALKRIEKGRGSSSRDERFRREISFGRSADHDNVVRIHATREDDDSFSYTMDLYSHSLRDVIAEETDYEVLLGYLAQLSEGLAYVHSRGIVHRDIKPENILVDPRDRRLVIADFGIAHFKDSTLTKRGELLANRNYLAPEQMAKKDAREVGKSADVFALGLIFTEAFTKQNARGARHLRVRDVHPFLSDLDLLVERMTLQAEEERIDIDAVRDSLDTIRRRTRDQVDEIADELHEAVEPDAEFDPDVELAPATNTDAASNPETTRILRRAAEDVLSAKYIFERVTDHELSRYNTNYHCEIGYRAKTELFNLCLHAQLYKLCKTKFECEGNGEWHASDLEEVASPHKEALIREFESLQSDYPLPRHSSWNWLPRLAAHYFRFCKGYHCDELVASFRQLVSETEPESLRHDLIDVPILRLVSGVRRFLGESGFGIPMQQLPLVEIERQIDVQRDSTCLEDQDRVRLGTDLFDRSLHTEFRERVLGTFTERWNASLGERADGSYSVHFRPRAEYLQFREEALALAAPYYVFEGDVLDLLRPEAEYEDLVTLCWEPVYEIPSVLSRILGLREISETPTHQLPDV